MTAVEWYGGQIGLLFHLFHTNRITITEFHYQSLELEKNAKEMEKEQIIDAYDKAGKSVFHITGHGLSEKENKDFLITAEQYYNETYGKDKSET